MERQRYDTQHYHAFTRGEATTGWNHSTELASMNQRSAQLQQANSQALAATAVHKQHITRCARLNSRAVQVSGVCMYTGLGEGKTLVLAAFDRTHLISKPSVHHCTTTSYHMPKMLAHSGCQHFFLVQSCLLQVPVSIPARGGFCRGPASAEAAGSSTGSCAHTAVWPRWGRSHAADPGHETPQQEVHLYQGKQGGRGCSAAAAGSRAARGLMSDGGSNGSGSRLPIACCQKDMPLDHRQSTGQQLPTAAAAVSSSS